MFLKKKKKNLWRLRKYARDKAVYCDFMGSTPHVCHKIIGNSWRQMVLLDAELKRF